MSAEQLLTRTRAVTTDNEGPAGKTNLDFCLSLCTGEANAKVKDVQQI